MKSTGIPFKNKYLRFLIPALLCLNLSLTATAQEKVLPLYYNPVIKDFLDANPSYIWGGTLPLGKAPFNGNLPFAEDFSTTFIYPDSSMWMDNDVYINNNFPVKPPSIGVATFDGLDMFGNPYDKTDPDRHGYCDTLTSKPIVMGLGTVSPSDSVFMSFFVQNQGRGDEPELTDSLILQFKDSNSNWTSVWSERGSAGTSDKLNGLPFVQYMLAVEDTLYFHNNFQFRFINYGNFTGNLDHWHLDYIVLDKNRNKNVTTHQDVAITYVNSNFLKKYRSMPWNQFLADLTEKADTHSMVVRNLDNKIANVQFEHYSSDKLNNTVAHTDPNSSLNVAENSLQSRALDLTNFKLEQKFSGDTVIIDKRYGIFPSPSDNKYTYNDTLHELQVFNNYFAYDDGSAESGWGIDLSSGKVAYKFTLNEPDTLRAISIFFNQSLRDVSTRGYQLTVWSKLTQLGTPHDDDDVQIYSEFKDHPEYPDTLNGFYTFILSTPLKIEKGDFYIGWVQNSVYFLNVGLDRNYPDNEKMKPNPNLFFNVAGFWRQSTIPGTIMLRPHFSKTPILASAPEESGEKTDLGSNITVFPNPASSSIWVKDELNRRLTYELFSIMGNYISDVHVIDNRLDVSRLKNGTYILKISEMNSTKVIYSKFIVIK
jgi:hypothetical protein